jgi:hypothetical protein
MLQVLQGRLLISGPCLEMNNLHLLLLKSKKRNLFLFVFFSMMSISYFQIVVSTTPYFVLRLTPYIESNLGNLLLREKN